MRYLASPYLLLVLNMLIWSGNWIVGRAFREDFSPLGLNFWRWVIALAVLLPFTWREIWDSRAAILTEWKALLGMGILGISLFNMFIYLGLKFTTAVNGVLIHSSQPVVIVLLAWMLLGERINVRQGVGIVVSLTGVMVLVSRGEISHLLGLSFNRGDIVMALSVPVWGLYTILLRRKPSGLKPAGLITVLFAIGTVFLAPGYIAAELWVGPQVNFNLGSMGGLLYVALFSSVVGLVFYNMGVAALGAAVAGLFLHLVPVFTIVLAWLILGETLQWYHLPGVALIFSGIFLTSRKGRAPP